MKATITIVISALISITALEGRDQNLEITSIQAGGEVSWTSSIKGVFEYRVQGSDTFASGSWTNDLIGILPTGSTMSVTVPVPPVCRFYRLAAVTNFSEASYAYLVVDLADGPSASSYPVGYLTAAPAGGWLDEYKTTKLVLRRIPAGTFTMGSPANELGRYSDETQHVVTVTQPFYLGVFEVTQKQWERVMGTWPSYFTNASYRDSRPVEEVSYYQIREDPSNTDDLAVNWPSNSSVNANSFMGKLRSRTGRAFDLPTESQWEYAGRAGTETALNSGYNLTNFYIDTHMGEVGRYWFNGGSGYTQNGNTSVATAKVGSYLPNAWGLYDIHGNVWEWCLDWYGEYPTAGENVNPAGTTSGSVRVDRGGGWGDDANVCRVAIRDGNAPDHVGSSLGFRAALPLGP